MAAVIASAYCLVTACRFDVGSALRVRNPVIVPPDSGTALVTAAAAEAALVAAAVAEAAAEVAEVAAAVALAAALVALVAAAVWLVRALEAEVAAEVADV